MDRGLVRDDAALDALAAGALGLTTVALDDVDALDGDAVGVRIDEVPGRARARRVEPRASEPERLQQARAQRGLVVAVAAAGDDLAEQPERVEGGYQGRAAVLVNGLGTVKYEELFVVYAKVAALLEDAGITPVRPEVGELVTSLDMAGLSLTLVFLDEELELRSLADTWADVDRRLTQEDMRQALDDLPDDQRRVVELAYFCGMSQSEIAARDNTPLGTIKGRMRLGLNKLRTALTNVGDEHTMERG